MTSKYSFLNANTHHNTCQHVNMCHGVQIMLIITLEFRWKWTGASANYGHLMNGLLWCNILALLLCASHLLSQDALTLFLSLVRRSFRRSFAADTSAARMTKHIQPVE